jgi:hypothetical protein
MNLHKEKEPVDVFSVQSLKEFIFLESIPFFTMFRICIFCQADADISSNIVIKMWG